jgi:hypothetical protein
MSNTLRIKRRASGASGAPSSLSNAELAFNEVDDTLYYGKGSGGAGGTATTVEAIGGRGAFVSLTGNQTISGTKAFTGALTAPTMPTVDSSTNVATTAWVNGQGYLTSAVSSVGLSLPSFITVTNSPVTVSGTLTGTLATQTANTVFAAPNGSSGAPTFRTLASADIPDLSASYLPIAGGTITSNLTVTGNLTVNGTTTTVNSTTIDVADKNITLGNVASPTNTTADGGGITLRGTTDKTFNWVSANSAWTSSESIRLNPQKGFYLLAGTKGFYSTASLAVLTAHAVSTDDLTVTNAISGSVTGTAANVTGTVAIANGGTGATDAPTARTNLGLGTIATQAASNVSITGGSIDNITLDGGTF